VVGIVGIDQAFHKCVIIDLKRETITFEADGYQSGACIRPLSSIAYIKPTEDTFDDANTGSDLQFDST